MMSGSYNVLMIKLKLVGDNMKKAIWVWSNF